MTGSDRVESIPAFAEPTQILLKLGTGRSRNGSALCWTSPTLGRARKLHGVVSFMHPCGQVPRARWNKLDQNDHNSGTILDICAIVEFVACVHSAVCLTAGVNPHCRRTRPPGPQRRLDNRVCAFCRDRGFWWIDGTPGRDTWHGMEDAFVDAIAPYQPWEVVVRDRMKAEQKRTPPEPY